MLTTADSVSRNVAVRASDALVDGDRVGKLGRSEHNRDEGGELSERHFEPGRRGVIRWRGW